MKFAVFILSFSILQAHAYSSYDYRSGNSYNVGSGSLSGNNLRTGSSWRTSYGSGGSYRGVNKSGDSFYGNSRTGYYYNSGSGRTCTGKGISRVCY